MSNFNNRQEEHAFLGASKYHWLNYSDEQLVESYKNRLAAERGTIIHAFAKDCIMLNEPLPKKNKTLNMYVNDAIAFRMEPERKLFYSDNCFGTADSVVFRNGKLRIHDLKTGTTPAHMEQLMIYAALYCLETKTSPESIKYELRIYQNDEVICFEPSGEDIHGIIEKIIHFDALINKVKAGEDIYEQHS